MAVMSTPLTRAVLGSVFTRPVGAYGSSPVVLPLRSVAVQNVVAASFTGRTGKNRASSRYPYVIAVDCSSLVVSLDNWYMSSSGQADATNTYSIIDQSLEREGTAYTVPVTYGGLRTKTMDINAVNEMSDEILPSAFGLSKFSKGDIIWIKTHKSVPSAGNGVPTSITRTDVTTGAQVRYYDSAATTQSSTDATGVYTYTGSSPDTQTSGFRPILLGRPLEDVKTWFSVTDSIGAGVGDNGDTYYGPGWIGRAMHDNGTTVLRPSINMGRGGTTTASYLSTNTRPFTYAQYCTDGIIALGTNNVSTGTSSNVNTIYSALVSIRDRMRDEGIDKVLIGGLGPRTTSSDSWATVGNQTSASGWLAGENANDLNDLMVSGVSNGDFEAVFLHPGLRAGSNYWKFRVSATQANDSGTSSFATGDGLHPNGTGSEYMAVDARVILAAAEA